MGQGETDIAVSTRPAGDDSFVEQRVAEPTYVNLYAAFGPFTDPVHLDGRDGREPLLQ